MRGGAAMPEDTSPTESVMLEPDSPKIASGGKPDKEEGELVIPAKATVGENTIIDINLTNPKEANTGHHRVLRREEWLSQTKKQRKHKRAVTTLKIICS